MEIEITSGTVEIDTDEIRYLIEDDILAQVNDMVDYDDIRMAIEDEILAQVNDYVDFDGNIGLYNRTHELDFDEIRYNIEDEILSNVDEYIDYDEIMSRVNDEMFEINQDRMHNLEQSVAILRDDIKNHHVVIDDLFEQLREARMSVWSRIVRYVRSWF